MKPEDELLEKIYDIPIIGPILYLIIAVIAVIVMATILSHYFDTANANRENQMNIATSSIASFNQELADNGINTGLVEINYSVKGPLSNSTKYEMHIGSADDPATNDQITQITRTMSDFKNEANVTYDIDVSYYDDTYDSNLSSGYVKLSDTYLQNINNCGKHGYGYIVSMQPRNDEYSAEYCDEIGTDTKYNIPDEFYSDYLSGDITHIKPN